MTTTTTPPDTAQAGSGPRQPWHPPRLTRLATRRAEESPSPSTGDGQFSVGS